MTGRTIRVTGKGRITVSPDTIKLSIDAESVYKEYETTIKKSAEDIAILRETIKKAGLDPKELKTVRFGIDADYESYRDKDGNYKRKFNGYKYTHDTYIQFSNDNKVLGKVLRELANCPVKVEFRIRHTVKDVEAVKNNLLGKAVEDSRIKAKVLSKAAGVSLGEIKAIDYSWGELEIYSEPMYRDLKMPIAACDTDFDIDIEADDIDVQDTVTVVWEIQ